MKYQTRTNQGGSVIVFIVVAILLIAALVAGVFYIYRLGENARSGAPIFELPISNPFTSNDTSDEMPQAPQSRPAEQQPVQPTQPSEPSQPSENAADDTTAPTTLPAPEDTASSPATIPQTGPADSVVTLLLVTIFTFAAASYIQSRRRSATL